MMDFDLSQFLIGLMIPALAYALWAIFKLWNKVEDLERRIKEHDIDIIL